VGRATTDLLILLLFNSFFLVSLDGDFPGA
jgi:hypothetical protein